ncbi:MAG: hypothetical protein LBL02_00810 [Endomicrobium sp.]|jgi:hypothetical protein|nr:hypothetical protein [Endomicrobium sp.]
MPLKFENFKGKDKSETRATSVFFLRKEFFLENIMNALEEYKVFLN